MGPADVVLASCAALPTGYGDDDALLSALPERGAPARWAPWNDPGVVGADLVEPSLGWGQVPRAQRAAALSRFVNGVEGLLASNG